MYLEDYRGTKGQQDDPRLYSMLSNANWAKQSITKGTTSTRIDKSSNVGPNKYTAKRTIILRPIVRKADAIYP